MSRSHVKMFLVTLLIHGAILLFGGLLLFRGSGRSAVRDAVELISETSVDKNKKPDKDKDAEKKEADKKEAQEADERIEEVKASAPDLHELAALPSANAGPALAPLSLGDLESSLNPAGEGSGDFGGASALASGGRIGASGVGGGVGDMETVLTTTDLDKRPRTIVQTPPTYPMELRRQHVEGTVQVVFLVDTEGRVLDPRIEKSTNPAFERPAIEAIRQWRFEAGTRNGEKVQFKLRVPITFSAS